MARKQSPFRHLGPSLAPRGGDVEPRGGGFDAPEGAGPVASPSATPPAERPLSVSALSARIAGAMQTVGPVVVQGELSQAKVHGSGHFYATLKDDQALISVVMWRSSVARQGRLPGDGEQVVVRGDVTTYPPRGQYQLTARSISAVGLGDLAARFEALKKRLLDEGLFAEEGKRELPFLPRAIGIATAAGSAALADMLHSISARFPGMPVIHVHCAVQGPEAAPSIAAALQKLAQHAEVDVIICGRGGGNLEDLWAFNEEAVVRAIAESPVPVISAVGHETDTTLADLVADVRAKTPTAAGELVVPERAELEERLDEGRAALDAAIDDLLATAALRLRNLAAHRALTGPQYQIELRRQRLDDWASRLDDGIDGQVDDLRRRLEGAQASLRALRPERQLRMAQTRLATASQLLTRAVQNRHDHAAERLAALAGRLHALSPLAVIARGYAVLRNPAGTVVRQLADAPIGSTIAARVADGWIEATVDTQRRQGLREPTDIYEA